MTKKEPELQIKTSLNKFAGFLKALALIGLMLSGSVGAGYLGSKQNVSNDFKYQDSVIHVIQTKQAEHEIRLKSLDQTSVEIKASLIDIQKDIKTLLYISGKYEGRQQ